MYENFLKFINFSLKNGKNTSYIAKNYCKIHKKNYNEKQRGFVYK